MRAVVAAASLRRISVAAASDSSAGPSNRRSGHQNSKPQPAAAPRAAGLFPKTIRIAAPVPLLMIVAHDRDDG